MASTAPAHVLLSAAGYALLGKERLPSLMSTLGCLGWFAQAAAVFFMLRRALGDRGAAFVALVIAFGAAWSHRFVALETNLVMACVLWAFVSAIASRWLATAALVALAGLFRSDAYLVALPRRVRADSSRRTLSAGPRPFLGCGRRVELTALASVGSGAGPAAAQQDLEIAEAPGVSVLLLQQLLQFREGRERGGAVERVARDPGQ
jgi:hypothetical protein